MSAFSLLNLLLLLHHHGVWLHIDRDNEGGEGVSTDDTPVEHNVLGGYLSIINKLKWALSVTGVSNFA